MSTPSEPIVDHVLDLVTLLSSGDRADALNLLAYATAAACARWSKPGHIGTVLDSVIASLNAAHQAAVDFEAKEPGL